MIDLTIAFRKAYENRSRWTREHMVQAAGALRDLVLGSEIDWEEGDENWLRILRGDQVIAIFNADSPISFVNREYFELADQHVQTQPLNIIYFSDFDAQDYSIDKKFLQTIVSRNVTANIDYNRLSVSELWFATVT